MKTSPFLTLSVAMSLAAISTGCITVSGVDVGGIDAKADVKANTNISGNTVKTGGNGEAESEPTPPLKATPVPSTNPEPSTAPSPSSSATPGPGVPVSAEVEAIAEELSALAAGDLHAEYYSFMADDAAESEGNIIANGGLSFAVLYLTEPLTADVQAKRAEWKARLRSLAQGAYEARGAEKEDLFRAFRNTGWMDSGDGTERKKVTFDTMAVLDGRSPVSRQVELERIRSKEGKMAVLDRVVFTQTTDGRPVKTTRTKELRSDGSEVITYSATEALIASNGAAYQALALGRVASIRWTATVAADSAVSGAGTIVVGGTEVPLMWGGSAFDKVARAEVDARQWIRLSIPMGGAVKAEGWGSEPPGVR